MRQKSISLSQLFHYHQLTWMFRFIFCFIIIFVCLDAESIPHTWNESSDNRHLHGIDIFPGVFILTFPSVTLKWCSRSVFLWFSQMNPSIISEVIPIACRLCINKKKNPTFLTQQFWRWVRSHFRGPPSCIFTAWVAAVRIPLRMNKNIGTGTE